MRNGKLYTELYKNGGFHFPSGSSPGVGVGGLATGGGRGMTVRKFGLSIDNIVSFTAVIADGSVVVASATSNSDLYWAMLGGGGGSFGIVTAFNVKVYKTPVNSLAFIRYSIGADYFNIFQTTLANLPPEYSTSCRIESTNSYVIINYLGPMADLQALLSSSGLLQSPYFQWVQTASCDALGARSFVCCGDFTCKNAAAILSGAYAPVETTVKDYEKSKSDIFYTAIPLPIVNQMVSLLSNAPRPDAYIDCYMSDGPVVNSKLPTDTPYPNRNAGMIFMCEYCMPTSNNGADYYPGSPNYIWLQLFEALLKPYASGFKYYNYADLELTNFGQAYWGDANFRRLIQIKNKYDPNNWFRSAQSIPLTYPESSTSLPSSITTTVPATSTGQSFNYIGCYIDSINARAMSTFAGDLNSITACYNYAKTNGYTYFGTQWYNGPGAGQFECWCTNNFASTTQYGVASATSCLVGSDKVYTYGGGGANAVYTVSSSVATTNASPTAQPIATVTAPISIVASSPTSQPIAVVSPITSTGQSFNYIGCYIDSINARAMSTFAGDLNSITACYNYAKTNGYTYFGTQWYNGPGAGQFECWCTNNFASTTQYGVASATSCLVGSDKVYTYGGGGANAVYKL